MENIKFAVQKSDRKATFNVSVDTGVKTAFKLSCVKNNTPMSGVIETLMESYVIESRRLHLELEG